MRKNILWLLILLSVLGGPLAADKAPYKYVRLTIINKSDMPIGVKLNGVDLEQFYYLKLEKGSREHPIVGDFTVVQDTYTAQVYYIEYWDPVYGYRCDSTATSKLDITHPHRLTVLPCNQTGCYSGESNATKLPSSRPRRGMMAPR